MFRNDKRNWTRIPFFQLFRILPLKEIPWEAWIAKQLDTAIKVEMMTFDIKYLRLKQNKGPHYSSPE